MVAWSRRAVPITPSPLGPQQPSQGIDGGAGIGVEAAAAMGADAAPVADEEGAAEQVGPDVEAVEVPFVAFGADADQGRVFGEQRQLTGGGLVGGGSGAFGHGLTGSVTRPAWWGPVGWLARRGFGGGEGAAAGLSVIHYDT